MVRSRKNRKSIRNRKNRKNINATRNIHPSIADVQDMKVLLNVTSFLISVNPVNVSMMKRIAGTMPNNIFLFFPEGLSSESLFKKNFEFSLSELSHGLL